MAANGISTLPTKEARQIAKLNLAETDRANDEWQARRDRAVYDITELPTQYSGNDIVNNTENPPLIYGRPWSTGPAVSRWPVISDTPDETFQITGGLTVTKFSDTDTWCRSDVIIPATGKFAFQLTFAGTGATEDRWSGVISPAASLTAYATTPGTAYWGGGDVSVDTVSQDPGLPTYRLDIIEVLVDKDADTVRFKKNGAFISGASYALNTLATRPAAFLYDTGESVTFDFGQTSYTAPVGYQLLNDLTATFV